MNPVTIGRPVTVDTGTRERPATLISVTLDGATASVIFDGAQHICTYPAAAIAPADECDAPSDWDSGAVTFDPYV